LKTGGEEGVGGGRWALPLLDRRNFADRTGVRILRHRRGRGSTIKKDVERSAAQRGSSLGGTPSDWEEYGAGVPDKEATRRVGRVETRKSWGTKGGEEDEEPSVERRMAVIC